jgi:hypothetical protein
MQKDKGWSFPGESFERLWFGEVLRGSFGFAQDRLFDSVWRKCAPNFAQDDSFQFIREQLRSGGGMTSKKDERRTSAAKAAGRERRLRHG